MGLLIFVLDAARVFLLTAEVALFLCVRFITVHQMVLIPAAAILPSRVMRNEKSSRAKV